MRKKVWLANFITIFHFGWAILIVLSLPLSLVWPWYSIYAMGSIPITLASWLFLKGSCFLTHWENKLRQKYDPKNAYGDEACFYHYLQKCFRVTVPFFLGNVIIGVYIVLTLILDLKRVL